jgi:aminopeptidase 2
MQDNIYPTNYNLTIKPNLNKFTFEGHVIINLVINELFNNNKIVINSKNLIMKKILLDEKETSFEYNVDNDLLIIRQLALDNIVTGTHILDITYDGIINNDLCGFYRSTYLDTNGETQYVYSTQCEPIDFRQICPSFDDPSKKATFDVIIIAPKGKTVLSNAGIKFVKDYGKNTITVFETTPKMSTYLVCFVIGDFIFVEKHSNNGVRIRVYATKENYGKLDFALNTATTTLDLLDRWFDVKYIASGLSKLDLIAINQFSAGAMENYGILTFRPEYLICDMYTELSKKQNIIITCLHEISHLWFGDLVTMRSWKYLWLNESFATFFASYVADILFPEMNFWDKFIDDECLYALNVDSLTASHPIEMELHSEKDINQIFDGISYAKGSCLLRFLFFYMGQEAFQKGLQTYIKSHMFKNTTTDDLWNALSESSGLDIKSLMDSWIYTTGYPVISIDTTGGNIKLTQQRFFKSGPSTTDKTKWIVPLKLLIDCESSTELSDVCAELNIIVKDEELLIPYNDSGIPARVLANPGRTTFCRIQYKNLTFNINELSMSMQKQILSDSFALSLSGYDNFENVFKLLKQLNYSTLEDFGVWNTVLPNMTLLYRLLKSNGNSKMKNLLKRYINVYILTNVKKLLSKVGYIDVSGENINETELRPLLINFLSFMKDPDVIKYAKESFNNGKYKYILETVGRFATKYEYNKLVNLLETNLDPQLKDDIISGLASVSDNECVDYMINEILLSKIKEQDISKTVHILSLNTHATQKLWNYIRNQWSKILTIHKPGSSSLSHLVKSVASGMCTEKHLREYLEFFSVRPDGTDMVIDQTIESIMSKLNTVKRLSEDEKFIRLMELQ